MAAIIARLGLVRTSASWRHAFKPAAAQLQTKAFKPAAFCRHCEERPLLRIHALAALAHPCAAQRRGNPVLHASGNTHAGRAKLSPACGFLPSLRGAQRRGNPVLLAAGNMHAGKAKLSPACGFLPSLRGAQRRGNPVLHASGNMHAGRAKLSPACGQSRAFTGLRPKQSFHRPAAFCRHCEERSDVAIQCFSLRATCMPEKQSFHRPAAGEVLFTAEKDPKRLAPGARRLGSCLADPLRVLATAGRRRTHTSLCSNNGAYSLRLPATLAALYGASSLSTAHPCATARILRFIPRQYRYVGFAATWLEPTDCFFASFASFAFFADWRFTLFPWSCGPVVPWSLGPLVRRLRPRACVMPSVLVAL
jgi:hypothetical protein